MKTISSLSLLEKSLLFAQLSSVAYLNLAEAKKASRKLGFTTVEFYDRDGAQAYRFQNKTDLVIACRGTQPTEFQDLGADMKDLWFCGHSLGAAMATIMASRCMFTESLGNPVELYTFGSPRVGWKGYCNSLGVVHHRWKNNNDIVTSVPPRFMGFKHHGTEHYINAYGNLRTPTGYQRVKDKIRGIVQGLSEGKIDSFSDHGIGEYIRHIRSSIK